MPRRNVGTEPSLEGFGGAIVGFTLAYLASESALPHDPHPIHWLLTLVGAACGYAVSKAVFYLAKKPNSLSRRHPVPKHQNRPRRRPPR